MQVEVGDLLFCYTVGNRYGWHLNQVGLVTEGNPRKTKFRVFLGSGRFSEVTQGDLAKGNIEILSKSSGIKIKTNLKKIPKMSIKQGIVREKN